MGEVYLAHATQTPFAEGSSSSLHLLAIPLRAPGESCPVLATSFNEVEAEVSRDRRLDRIRVG